MTVFIRIANNNQGTVYEAKDYQKKAYDIFMNSYKECNEIESINFNFLDSYKFKITKFDNVNKYPSFCFLINEKREYHILSNDEQLLRNYNTFINRLMDG